MSDDPSLDEEEFAAPSPSDGAEPEPSLTSSILRAVIPLVVLIGAVVIVKGLAATREEPARTTPEAVALLVGTETLEAGSYPVRIEAQGQVTPARQVAIASEIPGRIRQMSDELVPGGRFNAGDLLFRIDSRQYSLAVQSRASEVERARLEVSVEARRREVAAREWEAFGGEDASAEGRAMALRQPQQQTVEVAVTAAENAVRTARLNLQRAVIRAPFNATVLAESVDVGQYVGPGSPLATLVGSDAYWVRVSVPLRSLSRVRLPVDGTPGSPVLIQYDIEDQTIERTGTVVRLLPDLDPGGSMARVLVEIADPLRLNSETESGPPLLLGAYVRAIIEGGEMDGIEVPRRAIREGNTVYVMTAENTLSVRQINIGWSRENSVIATDGVQGGDQIIISRVMVPVDGMPLRTGADR